MGFYSYTCAKTGLPIMAGSVARGDEEVLAKATLITPRGERYSGTYDGYGRLGEMDAGEEVENGAKLVLTAFYKGESFDALGKSHHDPGQGFFHDWQLVRAGHGIIEGGFEKWLDPHVLQEGKWSQCCREHGAVDDLMKEQLAEAWGVKPHVLSDLLQHWERDSNMEGSGRDLMWKKCWAQEVEPELDQAPDTSPFKTMPPMAAIHACKGILELTDKLARNEALNAWREDRYARVPEVKALLADPMSPQGWLEEPALDVLKRKNAARRAP